MKYLRNNFNDKIEIILSEQGTNKTEIDGVDIHVLFNDDGLFQRSKVLNNGVLAANYDKIFVGDNDVIIEVAAINKCLIKLNEYEVVNPYDRIADLSEAYSDNFRLFLNLYFDNSSPMRDSIVFSGGCFAILKDTYIRLGGFDEDIIGWGGEDDAFTYKIAELTKYTGVDSLAFHLYHDRGINGVPYHCHYEKNVEILNNVSNMKVDELIKYSERCREKLNAR